MISIYLCDDEERVRHQLKTALEWKIFIENYDMRVVCAASTAQELLDAAQDSRRGVYFLETRLVPPSPTVWRRSTPTCWMSAATRRKCSLCGRATKSATFPWPTFCFLRLLPRLTMYIFIRRTAVWISWAA